MRKDEHDWKLIMILNTYSLVLETLAGMRRRHRDGHMISGVNMVADDKLFLYKPFVL